MPFTRPRKISNGVSLSDKVRREIASWGFVSKDGTIDAALSAIVDELPPNKHGVSVSGSEHDMLTGADKLTSLSSVSVVIAAIMPFIEFEATAVPIFGYIPVWQSVLSKSRDGQAIVIDPRQNGGRHLLRRQIALAGP